MDYVLLTDGEAVIVHDMEKKTRNCKGISGTVNCLFESGVKSFIYVKLSKNTKWWMDEGVGWGGGGVGEITYIVVIFFILSPEIIQIIPKPIGYNYYDHTITRTTPAQNPTIALSVMQIKGNHLGFYINFMIIF